MCVKGLTVDGGGSSPQSPGVTRRRALQLGAVAAGSVTAATGTRAEAATGSAAVAEGTASPRSESSFDEGWLFYRGDASGAEELSFDDGAWRELDLPHDWSIEDLPYATAAAGGPGQFSAAAGGPGQFSAAAGGPGQFSTVAGGVTADPSLLVPKVPPAQPVPPPVIGPFDQNNSVGDGSVGYTVGGIGWYRKHFTLPDPGGTRHAELRFDGVYQNADVWLNGVHLGFHPYGYTPFGFGLTPHLNPGGTNVLAVRVDNSGKTSRWYSGSGIYRHTWLTVTSAVRIPLFGVYVTTPRPEAQANSIPEESTAHVEVSVANLGAIGSSADVRVAVLDPRGDVAAVGDAGRLSVAPGATGAASVDIPVRDAALWSPDSPNLYTARAEILSGGTVVDAVETTFGFRSLV
jgi:beta-galactosidase